VGEELCGSGSLDGGFDVASPGEFIGRVTDCGAIRLQCRSCAVQRIFGLWVTLRVRILSVRILSVRILSVRILRVHMRYSVGMPSEMTAIHQFVEDRCHRTRISVNCWVVVRLNVEMSECSAGHLCNSNRNPTGDPADLLGVGLLSLSRWRSTGC
jgi:hypothetical protein